MTHRLLHLASSAPKGQQQQTSHPQATRRSHRSHPSRTHLLLQLGQLARQVGHQFHGGLQLLLQAPDLVLLPVGVAADQRHGSHPREPVQVLLLKGLGLVRTVLASFSTVSLLCFDGFC